MDRYREAITKNPDVQHAHWPVYEGLREILIGHDLSEIDQAAAQLRRASGVE
ncbi:MAG: hypothetical protein ACRDGU_01570 [Actinomycetota bacterium]